MTIAAIREPDALTRSDVLACIPDLRAFAAMLAGGRRRADDLVRDTIEQTLTAVNRPRAGINLKLQMFSTLHRLHYRALRPSIEESAQPRESPSSKEDGFEFRRAPPHFRSPPRRAAGSADPDGRQRPIMPGGGRGMRMPHCRYRESSLGGLARDIAGFAGRFSGTKEKARRPAVGNLVRPSTGLTAQHNC